MTVAVRVEDVSKAYRLGESRRSLREAVARLGRGLVSRRSATQESILWALRGVSFEVGRGESLGIIGPNGAGKTTILKLLSKITQPTSGRVVVNGRVSALIELGAGFHPDLTGRENIRLNAAILGLSQKDIARRFDSIVAFSGLERFLDTPVKRYSSGMYVRLGFSVAAHVEPDVLLVDEVLAVGDAEFRQRCAQRIAELRRAHTTIVFISHNMPLVRSVCDTALYLREGRIQTAGATVDVITAYELGAQQSRAGAASEPAADPGEISPSGAVQITGVEIRGPDDEPVEAFSYSTPALVRVHYWVREPLSQPNLVLRFVRADGTTACMVRTADYGLELEALEGTGFISVVVDPVQLSTGAYVLDARLLGPLDGVPLAQAHSGWFQVLGLSPGHGESEGVFVPQVAWAKVERDSGGASAAGAIGTVDANP
jgi:ABC-type polysaccharide/polyol phosphate transport system ATPase subunit